MSIRVAAVPCLVLLCGLTAACAPRPRTVAATETRLLTVPAASTMASDDAGAPDVDAAPSRPAEAARAVTPAPSDDGFELTDTNDPRPFGALCRGPWRGVGEDHPYRGVRPEDNGGGECCPLDGRAFLCVITPGHQHQRFIYDHARFFDGTGTQPRMAFPVAVLGNQGMSRDARPILHLEALASTGGFLLRPDGAGCRKPPPELRDVCRAAGQYAWRNAAPVRLP